MPNMNAPVIPPPILPGSTHIVRLQEAVTMEELSNDEEYNDIMEDMQEECAKVRKSLHCTFLAWNHLLLRHGHSSAFGGHAGGVCQGEVSITLYIPGQELLFLLVIIHKNYI